METTPAPLLNTELTDRTLWFDGESSFNADNIFSYVGKYDVKYVNKITPTIQQYNKSAGASHKLTVKTNIAPLSFDWQIPIKYKTLDLIEYFSQAHAVLTEGMPDDEINQRERRLAIELMRYQELGLDDVLRTVIWVMNELTKNDVVWGIGRGSSTSSYALYLIGVHDVDSFAYDLDIDDFLRD